jgi:hypothetical protein
MRLLKKSSKKTLPEAVRDAQYCYKQVELWVCDEHRIGLIPCLRRIWAPKGERPIIKVQTKYEWLYLYAFVQPQTGKTLWYILPELSTQAFQIVLKHFTKTLKTSSPKHILLVLDQAPWHKAQRVLPKGLELIFQPPYSPELQPSEHLWQLSDEPLYNTSSHKLDLLQTTPSEQCERLMKQPDRVKALTLFHWWPVI